MKIGDKYSSYEDFRRAIQEYSDEIRHLFIIKRSRPLNKYKLKYRNSAAKDAPSELKYFSLNLKCIRSGNYKTTGTIRKCTTAKTGCEAMMNVKLSKCKQFLEIRALNSSHNHENTEEMYQSSHKIRTNIGAEMIQYCKEALKDRANKESLQNEIIKKTGKMITKRDLENFALSRPQKSFDCECGEKYSNSKGLKTHKMEHLSDKPHKHCEYLVKKEKEDEENEYFVDISINNDSFQIEGFIKIEPEVYESNHDDYTLNSLRIHRDDIKMEPQEDDF